MADTERSAVTIQLSSSSLSIFCGERRCLTLHFPSLNFPSTNSISMASSPSPSSFPQNYTFTPSHSSLSRLSKPSLFRHPLTVPNQRRSTNALPLAHRFSVPKISTRRKLTCKAAEVSVMEESSGSGGDSGGENWVPVVPLAALPKGERRVIIQDGETILLLWYKDEVFAIENRSPAEGAYSEGLLNAKLTQVFIFQFIFFINLII